MTQVNISFVSLLFASDFLVHEFNVIALRSLEAVACNVAVVLAGRLVEGDVHLSHDFRSVVYQSMDRLYTSWRTCTQEKCNSL
jgi:hypothetical protein